LPAHAAEIWKVNLAKSTFSPSANTLVLERTDGKAPMQSVDAKGNPTAGTFLVISKGKIFLAADDATYATSSGAVRAVDYNSWRDMKLVEIGDKVRSADHCAFACQAGLPDRRMTLTFTAKGDVSKQMSNILVLNK
jgi:hypothetical protein